MRPRRRDDGDGRACAWWVVFALVASIICFGIRLWKQIQTPDPILPPPAEHSDGTPTEIYQSIHDWYLDNAPELLTPRQRYYVRVRRHQKALNDDD